MVKLFIEPGYDVHEPVRDYGNAGIDFYIPNWSDAFVEAFDAKNLAGGFTTAQVVRPIGQNDTGYILIEPHGDVNIPSGIRSRLPANVALEANNKSGIAMKKKLVYGASVIDSNYQGIIHCHMINTSDKQVKIDLGTKIVQFIPRIIDIDPIEVDKSGNYDNFYADFEFNNRGDGAFGSTGIK